jgi:signal peptidase II
MLRMTDRLAASCRRAWLRFLIIFALLLAADLFSKEIAFARVTGQPVSLARDSEGRLPPIPRHEAITVVPKVLALQLTVNHGAVFGIGQGGRWIFVAFSLVAIGVILTLFMRGPADAWFMQKVLAAVLAGALGNLYDRLFIGGVRDMLLLFPEINLPFGWSWPGGATGLYPWIFNLADVWLVVGITVLVVMMWRAESQSHARER